MCFPEMATSGLDIPPVKEGRGVCAPFLESGGACDVFTSKGVPWKCCHVTFKAQSGKAMKLDVHLWSPEPQGEKCDCDTAAML